MPRIAKPTKCHPDRPHRANGLCEQCYAADYRKKNKEVVNAKTVIRVIKYLTRNPHKRNRRENPEVKILSRIRHRANTTGREFNLTLEDIVIPKVCPVLGLPLSFSDKDRNCSPSLDRIDNTKGYVKGNVIVVSNRANSIKRDATVEELKKIYEFYSALQQT